MDHSRLGTVQVQFGSRCYTTGLCDRLSRGDVSYYCINTDCLCTQ